MCCSTLRRRPAVDTTRQSQPQSTRQATQPRAQPCATAATVTPPGCEYNSRFQHRARCRTPSHPGILRTGFCAPQLISSIGIPCQWVLGETITTRAFPGGRIIAPPGERGARVAPCGRGPRGSPCGRGTMPPPCCGTMPPPCCCGTIPGPCGGIGGPGGRGGIGGPPGPLCVIGIPCGRWPIVGAPCGRCPIGRCPIGGCPCPNVCVPTGRL